MPSSQVFAVLCAVGLLTSVSAGAVHAQQATNLVNLAISLNEAGSELKTAQLKLKSTSQLRQDGTISSLDVELAKINVETAERKRSLLTEILTIETEATKRQVDHLRALVDVAAVESKPDELIRIEARLRILQAIAKLQ